MTRKYYDEDFKKHLVKIYNHGNHSYRGLVDEYGVAAPTIRLWVIRYNNSTSNDEEPTITNHIKDIFRRSRNNYGSRKIKVELEKLGYQVSRRRISRIMKENGVVSNYKVAQNKVHLAKRNESATPNIVDRKFGNRDKLEVAASEVTNKTLKTEFIYQSKFKTLEQLQLELAGYIYWYNNLRLHGSLGYMTPIHIIISTTGIIHIKVYKIICYTSTSPIIRKICSVFQIQWV